MVWKLGADEERDGQDHIERHVYNQLTITDTGAWVKVDGNGTTDDQVPVLFAGQLHNMPQGTNAEVHLIGNGADTDLKYAFVTGPRDKHYKSQPGESWGQNPLDPSMRHGYTANGLRLAADNNTIAEHLTGMMEIDVKNQQIYFRVPVKFKEVIYATVQSATSVPDYKK